jgi:alpha-N-arabinofuranosidase
MEIEAAPISFAVGDEKRQLAGLAGSASLKSDLLTVSVVNPHASLPAEAALSIEGAALRNATVSVLTHADLTAHNTFESPQTLRPIESERKASDRHTFPPASVTVIRGRLSS